MFFFHQLINFLLLNQSLLSITTSRNPNGNDAIGEQRSCQRWAAIPWSEGQGFQGKHVSANNPTWGVCIVIGWQL